MIELFGLIWVTILRDRALKCPELLRNSVISCEGLMFIVNNICHSLIMLYPLCEAIVYTCRMRLIRRFDWIRSNTHNYSSIFVILRRLNQWFRARTPWLTNIIVRMSIPTATTEVHHEIDRNVNIRGRHSSFDMESSMSRNQRQHALSQELLPFVYRTQLHQTTRQHSAKLDQANSSSATPQQNGQS